MKFENFSVQLAMDVAAKVGITEDQAHHILTYVAHHAAKDIDKTLDVSGLGQLHLINVAGASWADDFSLKQTIKLPSLTVASFKMDDAFKEIRFSGFERAFQSGIKWYEVIAAGNSVQVLCGLEGDPHTDPPDIIIRTEESMGLG